ncbi:helix-turn-helix transcriptional regulator [Cupriavidus gilardii]|uniref:helix-turn-helix transcriptional regulator n=1 Tax=Cupriavidus gilardii TaxID=82541 RepID=UPI001FD55847|nr:LuxR family transcriptional regulator [Cupriavidus gilardii]
MEKVVEAGLGRDTSLSRTLSADLPRATSGGTSARGPRGLPPVAGPHGIKVFGERRIVPVQRRTRQGGMPGLVEALLRESSHESRTALMQSAIRGIGFDWLGYGTATTVGGQVQMRTFLDTYSHPAWRDYYLRERYYEVDPRQPRPGTFGLPLVWDVSDLERSTSGGTQALRLRRFLDDLRDAGIRSGVFLNLPMPGTSDFVAISFASGIESRRWIGDPVIGQALTVGFALHEFLTCHADIPALGGTQRDGLSEVQRDILACLAQGLSDKQIANRMEMSIFNVDYHMRRLRSHFGVRNRVQLAHAATMQDPTLIATAVERMDRAERMERGGNGARERAGAGYRAEEALLDC